MFYSLVFCAAALSLEAFQGLGILPGTFDPLDLLVMGGIALIEGVIYTKIIKRRKRN
jgi:hypothetical protein